MKKPSKRRKPSHVIEREISKVAESLEAESPIAAGTAKRLACRMLAESFAVHSMLVAEKLSGDSNAEEVRTIPSYESNAKRLMAELKITTKLADDDDGGDDDDEDDDD
jgi:hypothetical protein